MAFIMSSAEESSALKDLQPNVTSLDAATAYETAGGEISALDK